MLSLGAAAAEAAQPAPKNSYIATSEGYNMEVSLGPAWRMAGERAAGHMPGGAGKVQTFAFNCID